MKRTLTLRYSITKEVSVDVPDDVFTELDIERIAQDKIEELAPEEQCDWDWEWDVKPQPIKVWE